MTAIARKAGALLTVAVLAGCTLGRDYAAPNEAGPTAFARAPAPDTAALPDADLVGWWRGFHDPELDWLVGTALADSPDVATAVSRLRQARYGVVVARARELPQVNANAGFTDLKLSKNAGLSQLAQLFGGGGATGGSTGAPSGVALPGDSIKTYSLGFDASWELDLFGGGRRGIEGARARAEVAEWQLRDVQVSLAAEVANTYLQLRLLQQRESVARAEAARQRRGVQLAADTARAGLAPAADAIRQSAGADLAEAAIEPLRAEQAVQVDALGVLVGKPPEALIAELAPAAPLPDLPPPVPPGLPSDLLRRRPDVRAAERQLAAATADVGVAVADLYPSFSLTGMAQLISSTLANLFEGDSLQLTGSGQAMFPLLDFGRRRASVRQREEARNQAYDDYRRTVLGALHEVEDALARIDGERRRNVALRAADSDAERALSAETARYAAGLVDQSAVLQAQQQVLSARDQRAASEGALRQDTAALYKALGGGWRDAPAPAVRAADAR